MKRSVTYLARKIARGFVTLLGIVIGIGLVEFILVFLGELLTR